MGFSTCAFVRSFAGNAPARVALVDAGADDPARREITYASLDRDMRRVAAALAREGLAPGDRVALIGDASVELVTAWLGAFAAGLVVLPLPPMSTSAEIAARVEHARCRAAIVDARSDARVLAAAPALPRLAPRALWGADVPPRTTHVDLPGDALAMLLYTSGTTGAPRGVKITHASLVAHTAAIVHHVLRLAADDVVAGFLPLSHSYGVRMTLLAPFYAGARTVLLPRFDPRRAIDVARREGVTWWPMVPTMASAIGREPDARVPTLRFATSAGAPLSPEIRRRAERALGRPVRDAYGLTEATFSTIDVPDDDGGVGTVGRPVPGVEVTILDPQGRPCPAHVDGEIAVRGQNVTAGYLDDDAATRLSLTEDGFFRTGDIGRVDEAGRLVVVDRLKDLIVRSGFNVVPAEVEAALLSFEGVLEAAVVGVPDDHHGEEIVAVIRADSPISLAALDAHARGVLSPVKVPRRYAFVSALPIGASGKVLRRALRASLVAGEIVSARIPA